ncbi:MAG: HAD-IC family P-type ATPase [Verrucomicrobia bacterium]|jgi:heavy metal translocating P-type ATPase|nr:HAD-IC family P-type ATPase [Verrucomicrobiota bacterium]
MTTQDRTAAVICRAEDDCDDLDSKLSVAWLRIGVAAFFAGQGMVFSLALNMTPPPFASTAYWILHGGLIASAVLVMAFLGGPLFASTFAMVRRRRLSIEGLFTLSLLGAFVGSLVGSVTGAGGVYYEIVAIVIAIYTFGRMLGERSQAKLRLESARLRERFDTAGVVDTAGGCYEVRVAAVPVGARVRVEPGAAFTLDGIVRSGVGYVQETSLTGEPMPVVRRPGERVRAGTWAVDTRFEYEVTAVAGSRELDQILGTIEAVDGQPSELQTQANELIQIFLPIVVGVSLLTAIVWAVLGTWMDAVLHSMAVLLVACPCALGLATPVAISQGLYRLARLGLVSRDGALIDALARTKKVFFDKTGTLSESSLRVTELWVDDAALPVERADLLGAVHAAESGLSHPVARALTQHLEPGGTAVGSTSEDKVVSELAPAGPSGRDSCVDLTSEHNAVSELAPTWPSIEDLQVLAGQGLAFTLLAKDGRHRIKVGEGSLAGSKTAVQAVEAHLHEPKGRRVYVIVDSRVVACFVLRERLRSGVPGIWEQLDRLGLKAHILTGDPSPELTLPATVKLEPGLSSAEKLNRVRAALESNEHPLFVGDGINDTEAMSLASGSIAMHSGTALARSVAMGQLTADRIEAIPEAVELARGIRQRLRGNLKYAAGYNVVGMALAAAGILHPIMAALIMLVSSFWVTTRALRSGGK